MSPTPVRRLRYLQFLPHTQGRRITHPKRHTLNSSALRTKPNCVVCKKQRRSRRPKRASSVHGTQAAAAAMVERRAC